MAELIIVEVSPRDGFQSIPFFIETEKKIEYINSLSECGFKKIEVTSFVKSDVLPQFLDAETVAKRIKRCSTVVYSAFVPNLTGAKRAIDCGINELSVFVSASETFSLKNINMDIAKSLKEIERISSEAYNNDVKLRVNIAMAFKCPFEGYIPRKKVTELARDSRNAGATEVCICDTSGEAEPEEIINLIKDLRQELIDIPFGFHFHVKSGTGNKKVLAAISQGCNIFDSSLGDIGGCPNTPSFLKNISTVGLINLCRNNGIKTNIELDKLEKSMEILKTILTFK
jgi:hydroxymethylglutaryl-CoA lyase